MQAKRSRVSSFGDSDAAIGGAAKKPLTALPLAAELESEQTPRAGILTMPSPEAIHESVHRHVVVHGKLASFLENCHFCRKRMFQNDDAFMYGCLRGFCSPECRAKQIDIEKLVEVEGVKAGSTSRNENGRKKNDAEKDRSGCRERFRLA